MIITCPECAMRYDLEDDRFLPNGRSVRCTACGESWFVPAPEPIEALSSDRAARAPRDDRDGRDNRRPDDRSHQRPDPREERESQQKSEPRFKMRMEADDDDGQESPDFLPPRDEKGRFLPRAAYRQDSGDQDHRRSEPRVESASYDDDFDDDEDDSLFDSPISRATQKAKADARRDDHCDNRANARVEEPRFGNRAEPRRAALDDADEDVPPKGWRKGKQFYVEDDEEEDCSPRSFFSRNKKSRPEREKDDRAMFRDRDAKREQPREKAESSGRDGLRFGESKDVDDYEDYEKGRAQRASRRPASRSAHSDANNGEYEDDYRDDREYGPRDFADQFATDKDDIIPGEATIVDADWEDVDDDRDFDAYPGRGFGKRVREERRRSTAVARMEDVRGFEPAMFDEQFFASLRVTPRELERAVTKARRRAESREKNRMTPWRAFGWSAWVAAIAGAAYAVVAYRDEIVKVAPSAAEAYAVVGIETDPSGLKIEDVRHRLAMSTGGPMIEITGTLRNAGASALDAPLLQAEALGPRGELLARWTFAAAEQTVSASGKVQFVTRNLAPEGVSEVALSFAPAQTALGIEGPSRY